MKGKYDVAYRNHIARSEVRPAADAEVAQDPVDGLNRAVSVEDGKSASRALDKSKTGHKSLRNRIGNLWFCLLYTSPSPRDVHKSRMPSSA